MLKNLKDMRKKLHNKKGFTLMEMLIVVAIIAVLIAIAIPTFNSALAKANAATDLANIRSGYASAQVMAMTEGDADGVYVLQQDGSVAKEADSTNAYSCKGTSEKAATGSTVGGKFAVNKTGNDGVVWAKDSTIYYTVADDVVTLIKNTK